MYRGKFVVCQIIWHSVCWSLRNFGPVGGRWIAMTFMVPRRRILLTLVIPWHFLWCHQFLTTKKLIAMKLGKDIPGTERGGLWWFWWCLDSSCLATSRLKFSFILWNISTSTLWIGTAFYTDIHNSQRIFSNYWSDLWLFPASTSSLTFLVYSWNFVHTSMLPSGGIVITLVSPQLFILHLLN